MAGKEFVYDAQNEVIVLRAAVMAAQDDERRKLRALVRSIGDGEFLVPQHAALWRALRALSDRGQDYSAESVLQVAPTEGLEVDIATLELVERGEPPENVDFHLATLRWDATRARVLGGSLPELVTELESPGASPERVASAARAVLRAVEGGAGRRHVHRPEELARAYGETLLARRTKGTFCSFGFGGAVDPRLSYGAAPGKTAVFAGLSGSGKTTFMANFAIELAKLKRRVLFCAWEEGAYAIVDVMIAILTEIPLRAIIQGTFDDEEQARLVRAKDWVARRIRFMEHAFYDDLRRAKDRERFPSNDRNQDIFEGYIAESGCDVVIEDLFERMLVDLRPDAVTKSLQRQVQMHKTYGMFGCIDQQLNLKDVERRADKRPTRDAIKGTGAYVEVADMCFGIHRDALIKRVPDDKLELINMKQRGAGAFWAFRFDWNPECGRISGGEEVPYDPGVESLDDISGAVTDPSAIRVSRSGGGGTGSRRAPKGGKLGRRDP